MTDPGNLRAFGSEARPLILDISQLARRVAWVNGKFMIVSFGTTYNFGSPSSLGITGLPKLGGTFDYPYPFQPRVFWNLKEKVTQKVPFEPDVTPQVLATAFSFGRGDVTIFKTPDGSTESAGATVGMGLAGQSITMKIHMPGNLASRPGEPTTYYDGTTHQTFFFSDGSFGESNAGFEHATFEQVELIRAGLNGSSELASWTGSLTITRQYDEPGSPSAHVANQNYNVRAFKFTGKTDKLTGKPKTEFLPISGTVSYNASGNSQTGPILGAKDVTIRYDAKSQKITVS